MHLKHCEQYTTSPRCQASVIFAEEQLCAPTPLGMMAKNEETMQKAFRGSMQHCSSSLQTVRGWKAGSYGTETDLMRWESSWHLQCRDRQHPSIVLQSLPLSSEARRPYGRCPSGACSSAPFGMGCTLQHKSGTSQLGVCPKLGCRAKSWGGGLTLG